MLSPVLLYRIIYMMRFHSIWPPVQAELASMLGFLGQATAGAKPGLATRLAELARREPQRSPLLAGVGGVLPPGVGTQELDSLVRESPIDGPELRDLEDTVLGEPSPLEMDAIEGGGVAQSTALPADAGPAPSDQVRARRHVCPVRADRPMTWFACCFCPRLWQPGVLVPTV